MVKRAPHPGPLPIGSADFADAEREKRSQRLDGAFALLLLAGSEQCRDAPAAPDSGFAKGGGKSYLQNS
jgi:hypothetical protein